MLHAGLDLSRKRLDYCLLDEHGDHVEVGAAPPDADGLAGFARRVEERHRQPVHAAVESMNGARFVHDTLERCGWEVEVADAQKVKGLAPLACKTDRIDAWVLAELSRRELVPAIWLPGFEARAERERARWRLFLLHKRSALKHPVHAQLLAFGHSCPVSDLFGRRGRELLGRLDFPEPWHGGVLAAVAMIDELDREIAGIDRELRALGAEHRYVPLLMSVPGIAWVLGYTIAAEIGDITRFPSSAKLARYTGGCAPIPVYSSDKQRHRLHRGGNRRLNSVLYTAAIVQKRWDPGAQQLLQRHESTKGSRGARRILQRHLVDIVYSAMQADQKTWTHRITRCQQVA